MLFTHPNPFLSQQNRYEELSAIAQGTDLSWERYQFWHTYSNNILHQLKIYLLKDWISERLTWVAVRASFDRFRLVAWTAALASSYKVEDAIWKFFIFWWVHIATLLQWLPRCGAFDERRDDSKFFLGLCGRLVFAASIARFRAVLLENASRTALGRFSFVRTDQPDPSLHNENFTVNQKYPARSVKS